jgi:hypothetical protein
MHINMNEKYRPVLPHEKRMWKIRHEPKMYEYGGQPDIQAILTLALMQLLIHLREDRESTIEWRENTNAPESSQPSENSGA